MGGDEGRDESRKGKRDIDFDILKKFD